MQEPTSKLSISKKDLEDPELYRLNEILNFISERIGATVNNSRFSGTTSTDKITTKLYEQVPGPNDVVPWGTIKKFLSPASVRQAWITNNWLGTPVRPIAGIDVPANQAGFIQAFVDTHALRLSSYPAASYEVGSLFYETDRDSLYQVQSVGGISTWVWISGLMIDAITNRPSDLGTSDNGFNFLSSSADATYSYRWNGSAWSAIDPFSENAYLYTYSNSLNSSLNFGRARAGVNNALSGDVIADILFKAKRNGSFVNAANVKIDIESAPTASTAAGRISIQTVNSSGSALTTRWIFTSDGNIEPAVDNAYDIGSSSNSIQKVWTSAINVKQGGASGDILVNDGSDNGVWTTPTSGSGSVLFARSTTFDYLTTSYADITGCSLSLNQDGDWAVWAVFQFYKDATDVGCNGQLDYDGTPETGLAQFYPATANAELATVAQQWKITVSGQPKTVKLQAKKDSGAASSYSGFGGTTIMAQFIG